MCLTILLDKLLYSMLSPQHRTHHPSSTVRWIPIPFHLRGSDIKGSPKFTLLCGKPRVLPGHAPNSRFPPILAANMQSPYAQVPCIPLCPRLEKKAVRRKQGSHNHLVLDQCVSTSLGPDLHGLFFQSGQQGSRWVLRARASF